MNSSTSTLNTVDGLPHYDFRKKKVSWEDFLKGFDNVIKLKSVLSPLTPADLADLFAEVEVKELRVESVLMNARTYSDVRKWGRDLLDIETEKEELQKGLMASIWGAYIMISVKIPDNIVIVTSEEAHKTCALLELGQEEFYNMKGMNDLKARAEDLHKKLNSVYTKMEGIIDRALRPKKE